MNRINIFTGTIATCLISLNISSCSKGSKTPVFNYEEQRIVSITDRTGNQTATFSYDENKHLTRIDYNYDGNPSVRFEYTLPLITAQFYKGAAPDITREKYVFTTLNGRVENIRMTKPDGTVYDTYLDYDAEGRMKEIGTRGISSGGVSLIYSLDCYFSYPQNHIQQVKLYGARGTTATDSMTFVRTYDPQQRHFDFNNIGFNYFGSFSTGVAYSVGGINDVVMPFPFFTSRQFVAVASGLTASSGALKSLKGEGKARDMLDFNNNGWKPISWDSEYNGSYYKYDDLNRLTEEAGKYLFTWKIN